MVNLYIRYFDFEVLASSYEEAFDFLYSIDEIEMNEKIENDVRDYMMSNQMYPKRYKVRPRIYFIMIKTTAKTMEEFKQNNKKALEASAEVEAPKQAKSHGQMIMQLLAEERLGWYEGTIDFKRVVVNPNTGKCIYKDTHFVARCKAKSGMDCYNRIIDHLTHRVDARSQFPSVKGKNFHYKYLGEKV